MKKSILFMLVVSTISAIVYSCDSDDPDQVAPTVQTTSSACDTFKDNTYNNTVKYIMQSNCTGCHNSNFSKGGVKLDSYEEVVKQSNNGNLMGTIQHQSGYPAMPPGKKIPSCQIDKIKEWVDANEPQ